jgi:hypothetical protein
MKVAGIESKMLFVNVYLHNSGSLVLRKKVKFSRGHLIRTVLIYAHTCPLQTGSKWPRKDNGELVTCQMLVAA